MNDANWKLIAEQEPEFVEFCKYVFWKSTLVGQPDFLKALFSFYQIGMTPEQTAQWLILQNRMGK